MDQFMKMGEALETVLESAKANLKQVEDIRSDPVAKKYAERLRTAINVVEDWGMNNLDEDD